MSDTKPKVICIRTDQMSAPPAQKALVKECVICKNTVYVTVATLIQAGGNSDIVCAKCFREKFADPSEFEVELPAGKALEELENMAGRKLTKDDLLAAVNALFEPNDKLNGLLISLPRFLFLCAETHNVIWPLLTQEDHEIVNENVDKIVELLREKCTAELDRDIAACVYVMIETLVSNINSTVDKQKKIDGLRCVGQKILAIVAGNIGEPDSWLVDFKKVTTPPRKRGGFFSSKRAYERSPYR